MSSTTRTDATATTGRGTTHAVQAVPESTDPTVTAARTETEDKLWQVLRANPNSTAAGLSTDAGIGRSTAAKILARWANEGSITRAPGITEGGRRAARPVVDHRPRPLGTPQTTDTKHTDTNKNATTTPSGTGTPATDADQTITDGDTPGEVTAGAEPDTAGKRTPRRTDSRS